MVLETLFFAIVAVLVLGRLYFVLGQNHGAPPKLNDNIGGDKIVPTNVSNLRNFEDGKNAPIEPNFVAPTHEDVLKAHWGELYPAIDTIKKQERNFEPETFLKGAAMAYETIIEAYGKNDQNTVRNLVNDKVFTAFAANMLARANDGKGPIDIVKFADPKIAQIEIQEVSNSTIAVIDVEFNATLTSSGENPKNSKEIWSFEKKLGTQNPMWILTAVEQK